MIRFFIIIILSVFALNCKCQNLDSLIKEAEARLLKTKPLTESTFLNCDSLFCKMYKSDLKRLFVESDLFFLYKRKAELIPYLQRKDSLSKKNIFILQAEKSELKNALQDAQKTLVNVKDIYQKNIAKNKRKHTKKTIFITTTAVLAALVIKSFF